jgi:mannosyl-oligosaccharide alpha-1,2-mannosidase
VRTHCSSASLILIKRSGALNGYQSADIQSLSAELGSLSLEFTRLSQLTGDNKYYDAVQRIADLLFKNQNNTAIPGLFPVLISPLREDFDGDTFSFGGMADSLYEYFPKHYLLLGGLSNQSRQLYEGAIEPAKKHLFFRPMIPQNQDILISGTVRTTKSLNSIKLDPEGQHLTCFAGGMVALGAKIFNRTEDMDVARKLVDGCIWVYDSMPTGVMPETFKTIPCHGEEDCIWSTDRWHKVVEKTFSDDFPNGTDVRDIVQSKGLQPGFTSIDDPRFLLRYTLFRTCHGPEQLLTRPNRPEAIESVFVLYRITGDTTLLDAAWRMFEAINNATFAEYAHSAIADVTIAKGKETEKLDQCESFWMAETLKYFYLIFSEPELVSLDGYVL